MLAQILDPAFNGFDLGVVIALCGFIRYMWKTGRI